MRGWPWNIVVIVVLIAVGVGIWVVVMGGGEKAPAGEGEQWTCPMHPSVVRSEPGDCPICGMDLVLVEEPEAGVTSEVEGHGVVTIEPERQQLIGVVTTPVERRALERRVRTVGLVTIDETRVSHVHTKVEGWIETVYAGETGKIVREGDPLLTIYSPELVSTQEEYLLALRAQKRLAESPFEEVRRSGESLLRTTRDRLRLWDIRESDIRRLEDSGEVMKALTLYAPSTGYEMEKEHALEGMRVTPGMKLYEVADLSRVGVEADVYEFEAAQVKVGQEARLKLGWMVTPLVGSMRWSTLLLQSATQYASRLGSYATPMGALVGLGKMVVTLPFMSTRPTMSALASVMTNSLRRISNPRPYGLPIPWVSVWRIVPLVRSNS